MRRIVLSLGALAFGFVTAIGGAAAQDRIKAGTLVCDVSGGIGMIIGSKKGVQCLFSPNLGRPSRGICRHDHQATGLDIGATTAGQMVWAVYAPSSYGPGALAGVYSGATAEATIAVGLGGNALVGGSKPHGRVATAVGDGPDRSQPRGRRRLAGITARALNKNFTMALTAACGRPFRLMNVIASCQSRCQLRRYCNRAGILVRPPGRQGRYYGTEWHESRGSPVHRAGGPVPKRQDHIAGSDPCAHRRDARKGTVEAGTTVGDANKESRSNR